MVTDGTDDDDPPLLEQPVPRTDRARANRIGDDVGRCMPASVADERAKLPRQHPGKRSESARLLQRSSEQAFNEGHGGCRAMR